MLELVDYVASASDKFPESMIPEITKMVPINLVLFRTLTSPLRQNMILEKVDADEEEPVMEPAWPHLQLNLVTRRTAPSMSTALLRSVIRQVHTSALPPRLTKFSLRPPKAVEVEYSDGSAFYLSAEFLRVYSPAVDSKIRMIGGEKVIAGRRHVGIMSAEPVGNYGVRIIFDDLHKTGIYTWDYFYQLGTKKFKLMRNYIETLKKHGLSRDPKRRT